MADINEKSVLFYHSEAGLDFCDIALELFPQFLITDAAANGIDGIYN